MNKYITRLLRLWWQKRAFDHEGSRESLLVVTGATMIILRSILIILRSILTVSWAEVGGATEGEVQLRRRSQPWMRDDHTCVHNSSSWNLKILKRMRGYYTCVTSNCVIIIQATISHLKMLKWHVKFHKVLQGSFGTLLVKEFRCALNFHNVT